MTQAICPGTIRAVSAQHTDNKSVTGYRSKLIDGAKRLFGRIKEAFESLRAKIYQRPPIRSTTTVEVRYVRSTTTRLSTLIARLFRFNNPPKSSPPNYGTEMTLFTAPNFEGMQEVISNRVERPGNLDLEDPDDSPDAFLLAAEAYMEGSTEFPGVTFCSGVTGASFKFDMEYFGDTPDQRSPQIDAETSFL